MAERDTPNEKAAGAPAPAPAPAPAAAPAPAHARLNDPVETGGQDTTPSRGWAPPRRGLAITLGIIVLAVLGALVVLYAWELPPFTRAVQSTDNAFVRGQTTVISPQVNGYVTQVLVADFQRVTAGQVLVRIDDRVYQQHVDQASANFATQQANLDNWIQSRRSSAAQLQGQAAAVGNAQAQLTRARADLARVEELARDRSVSLRERDQAVAALRQAEAALLQSQAQRSVAEEQMRTVTVNRAALEAAVDNARAALRLAKIDLDNTVITAPQEGTLSDVGVKVGQYVTSGTQLMFLVPPAVWVVANFKEGQTARMRPGQPATVSVDALAGHTLRGHVARISPAAGSEFSVIRPDNATGNFIKVPQRISVRIELEPNDPMVARLRPGTSVIARVDTSKPGWR